MSLFKNLRIGTRLIAAFMVLVAIGAIIGIAGLVSTSEMSARANEMYNAELMGLSYVKEANVQLIYTGRAHANYLLAGSQTDREKQLSILKKSSDATLENLEKAKDLFDTERAKELLGSFEKEWGEYQQEMQHALTLAAAQKTQQQDPALLQSINAVHANADALDSMLDELVEQKQAGAKKIAADTVLLYERSRNIIITIVVAGVAIGVLLGLAISRGVTRPLAVAVDAAGKLAKGDFSVEISTDSKEW